MSCGIYKITNIKNQKSYIGQSTNIKERWRQEKMRAFDENSNSYNTTLSKAFRKHGLNNFLFEILEECMVEELDQKEQAYIKKYDTYFNGYNETTGGQKGNNNFCVKISKEDLLIIYDLLLNSKKTQKEIAEQFSIGQDVVSTINHGKSRRLDGYSFPLRNNKNDKTCIDCGALITYDAIRCNRCEKIRSRKVERPTREELKDLIRKESFVKLGQMFGVSDKSISKWCVYYNLPFRKKDIKQYSDEEWLLI